MQKKKFEKLLEEFIEARNKLAEIKKVEDYLKKQVLEEMKLGDSYAIKEWLVEKREGTTKVKNVEEFLVRGLDPDEFFVEKKYEALKVKKVKLVS